MAGSCSDIGSILDALGAESADMRKNAVEELSQMTCDEAIAGLVMALEDSDGGIRELAADALSKVSGETTTFLLSEFLGAENIRTRNLAAEILVRVGTDAVPGLIGWLDHEDHDVRKFVVDVLGQIGDSQTCDGLCRSLHDPNENVVCSAAEALGLVGDPGACDALIAIGERQAFVRPQAIEALGKIGSPRAVSFIVQFLKCGEPLLMYSAAEALGNIGSPEALKELSEIVNDDSIEIAEEAFRSALKISEAIRVDLKDHIPGERLRRFIVDGLVEGDEDVMRWALRSPEIWLDDATVDDTLRRLPELNEELRGNLIRAMIKWRQDLERNLMRAIQTASEASLPVYLDTLCDMGCSATCVQGLNRYVDHEDPEVRLRVARTLGRTYNPEALDALFALAKDSVGHVRSQAYMSMGWVGDDRALTALIEGIDDKYADVRETCVGAMVAIGGSRVISQFRSDLSHDSPERCRLAAAALGWVGERESAPPLMNALSHSMAAVRKEALQALTRMGVSPDYDDLALIINDENDSVQRVAITALATFYPEKSVDALEPYLHDDDVWLAIHVVSALSLIATEQSVGRLRDLAGSAATEVRIAAINALADTPVSESAAFLEALDTTGNETLERAKAEALLKMKGQLEHESA